MARGEVDDPSGYVINIFWGAVNIAAMLPLIFAAMWTPRRAGGEPMRIRDALLSARSYLTILIGFLLGFAIVVWVEKQMPARVESSSGMTLSQDFPPLPAPRELTFDEAISGRGWPGSIMSTIPSQTAWPTRTMANRWLSLWSVGGYFSPWSPQSSCIL